MPRGRLRAAPAALAAAAQASCLAQRCAAGRVGRRGAPVSSSSQSLTPVSHG